MAYKTYANRQQMERDGYVFEGSGECNKCGATVDWAKTPHGKKIPFDVGSTTCHFDTCGKVQTAKQQPPAASARPGSQVASDLVFAVRALNANVIALNATMQALLARLGQNPVAGKTTSTGNGNKPEAGAPVGVMTNPHGVTVSDEDVAF